MGFIEQDIVYLGVAVGWNMYNSTATVEGTLSIVDYRV